MSASDLTGTVEQARAQLARLVPLAVETLQELALTAERDNVRLAAAEAILDRTGLGRNSTLQVNTSNEQHRQAEAAALELVERLARNRAVEALPSPSPALDTLLVLEGEPDELPLAAGPQGAVIEARAQDA